VALGRKSVILERGAPAGDGPDADGAEPRPSRSARKRNAEAMQKLGERLIALKPVQLQRFELPPELLDALLEAHRLRSRAALARQRQYIGRLMRGIDPEPVERLLAEYTPRRPKP
jgi:ribosome-associated protein